MRALIALALAAVALGAQAADDKKAPTAQQERMKMCNHEATGKKGDERKAFMKECLAGKTAMAAAAPASGATGQQDRMKMCNQEAAGKKGSERKAFMKECLSGKS